MADVLTTNEVAQRERFAYWRDMICDVFVQLDCERIGDDRFFGTLVNRRLGPLQVTEVGSGPQHVVRSRTQIAKGREDDFLVSLQVVGEGHVLQDGRTARLRPGDFALYDSTRPYELHFEGALKQLVFQMPRALLRERLGAPERLTAVRVPGGVGTGALASGFLRTFADQIDSLPSDVSDRVVTNAVDMLATGLWSVREMAPGGGQTTAPSGRSAMLASVKAFIASHMHDPDMSVAAVAAAHRISPRYLRILFEAEGTTPGRWLWNCRFERARADLADPMQAGRSISEIAFGWGFNELSHFSRGFRARYGQSPRAFRADAAGGGRA